MLPKIEFKGGLLTRMVAIFVLFGVASMSLAQSDAWTKKADMPTARLGLATAVVDGKIYAIGGYSAANFTGLQTVEEYDPATNSWISKAKMPTGRRWLAASTVNGKIYAVGGYVNFGLPGLSIVEEYDPATDSWVKKADMPTARLGLATAVVDGKIYAIGGSPIAGVPLGTVEAYDPLTDTWTKKADMPTSRFFLTTAVVDGKIYAIGGSYGSPGQVLSTVEVYDPLTDTWTTKTSTSEAKHSVSSTTVNGQIYVIGGAVGELILSTVEEYDQATDTWGSLTSMLEPRAALSTSAVGSKIYAIGGTLTAPPPHPGVSTVEEYMPPLASIHNIHFNSPYIRPGIDSLKIKCNVINPHNLDDLQANATIQSADSTFIENRPLYDDGLHEDGQANDGLWGAHLEPISIESEFLVNVTAIDADSTDHILDLDSERFTTIGPVVFDGYTFIGSDMAPNPGDGMIMKLTLKNEGLMATASNVTADLTALDTLSSVFIQANPSYGSIPAKESAVTAGFYRLNINEKATPGTEMVFRVDIASNLHPFWTDKFRIAIVTSVAEPSDGSNPTEFVLHQNYPNPFNPATTIIYSISRRSFVTLKIYDLLGNEIQRLVSGSVAAGTHSVNFDAGGFASGLYFYKLQAGDLVQTRKMLLIK